MPRGRASARSGGSRQAMAARQATWVQNCASRTGTRWRHARANAGAGHSRCGSQQAASPSINKRPAQAQPRPAARVGIDLCSRPRSGPRRGALEARILARRIGMGQADRRAFPKAHGLPTAATETIKQVADELSPFVPFVAALQETLPPDLRRSTGPSGSAW
jgi:hypothetical protein